MAGLKQATVEKELAATVCQNQIANRDATLAERECAAADGQITGITVATDAEITANN